MGRNPEAKSPNIKDGSHVGGGMGEGMRKRNQQRSRSGQTGWQVPWAGIESQRQGR